MANTSSKNPRKAEADIDKKSERKLLEYSRLVKNHQTQCPSCESRNTATIMYGLPSFSAQLNQEIESGLTVLGGCCSTDSSPDLYCNECGHRWKNYGWPSIFSIADSRTGLVWAISRMPTILSFEEALSYVEKIRVDDYDEWRLPTKAELWTLINTAAVSDDSYIDTYPLRKPFNSFCFRYIHTGDCVFAQKNESIGNYVMGKRNGYIFPCRGLKGSVFAIWKTPNIALYKLLIEQQKWFEQ